MRRDPSGWAWFEAPSAIPGQAPDDGPDLARAFARCFGGEEGRRVLRHLRSVTLERALGPGVAAETLRHIEGQRHLVAYMQTMVDRGRRGDGAAPGSRDTHQEIDR